MSDESMDAGNNAVMSDSNSGYPGIEDVKALGFDIESDDVEVPHEEIEQNPENKASDKSIDEMLEDLSKDGDPAKDNAQKDDGTFVIKHNGELKSLSKDDVISYAQKGFDYTQKTQALAEQEKEFKQRLEQFEKEAESKNSAILDFQSKHKQQIEEYNTLDFALAEMQEKDPGLFEEVARYYNEASKIQNTPANKALRGELEQLKKQIDDLSKGASQNNNQHEAELIREKFQTELKKLEDDVFPRLNKVGIKVDADKVREAWIEGEKSKLSVRQALDAIYGDQIRKAYESKLKVSRLESKGRSRSTMAGMGNGAGISSGKTKMSWNEVEQGGYKKFL